MQTSTIVAFLIGVILGGAFVAWVLEHLNIHQKIEDVETSIHDRFTALEEAIKAKLHPAPKAPDASAAPAASATPAAPAAPPAVPTS